MSINLNHCLTDKLMKHCKVNELGFFFNLALQTKWPLSSSVPPLPSFVHLIVSLFASPFCYLSKSLLFLFFVFLLHTLFIAPLLFALCTPSSDSSHSMRWSSRASLSTNQQAGKLTITIATHYPLDLPLQETNVQASANLIIVSVIVWLYLFFFFSKPLSSYLLCSGANECDVPMSRWLQSACFW